MASLVFSRIIASLRRVPDRSDWQQTALTVTVLTPLLAVCVLGSATMHWQPTFDAGTLRLALVALFAPAFGEELLFRAALIPRRGADQDAMPTMPVLAQTVAFVLWHPLQVLLFGGARAVMFLDPFFLLATALLGLACGRLYWVTQSVWPPVAVHWLVVVGWKALAGGPALV